MNEPSRASPSTHNPLGTWKGRCLRVFERRGRNGSRFEIRRPVCRHLSGIL